MTEVIDSTATADTGWSEATDGTANMTNGVSYPEQPSNPHNHRFTVSYDPNKPPFIVVRAQTAAELKEAFEELEESGALAAMGAAQSALKAQGMVGAGLGATTVIPAPQAPVQGFQQAPAGPPPPGYGQGAMPQQYPPQFAPQAPGSAPAAWQNAAGPQQPNGFGGGQQAGKQGPKPRPTDWPVVYKINVPFPQKESFKAFREQNKEILRGKVAWAGGGEYWIHGDVAQGFAQYSPMAA
jgi:hypothetical protein